MRSFRPRVLSLWNLDQQLCHQVTVSSSEIVSRESDTLTAAHYAKQFDFHNANGDAIVDLVSVVHNLADHPVPGSAGPTGPTGPAGVDGQVGATGPHGPSGATGPAGLDGQAGVDGPVGATGPTGPSGATGPAGSDGGVGATGATGVAGETGATGPAGPNGQVCLYSQTKSVTITNSTEETNLLSSTNSFGRAVFTTGSLISGATYLLRAAGQIKTSASANIQLQLLASNTSILTTGNFAVTAQSFLRGWNLEVQMVHDGTNLICVGQFLYMTNSNAMAGWCGQTTTAITANRDLTLTLLGNWTTSSSNNVITCTSVFLNKLS